MKVKKQKRHRRAVRFYTACFGFRDPFKILCDGTFVHHLLTNGITPADTALANTLGATVKIFTTRCVIAELRCLGDSFSDSLNAANSLIIARCDHEKRMSAVACITEVIGQSNPEHFFVATQDAELRKKFQEIPGVPVIYGLRNSLFLERPSSFQHEFAKNAEENKSHMTDLEYKMLKVEKKRIAASDTGPAAHTDEDSHVENHNLATKFERNGKDSKDKVQFKRKRAKGPNPLSCKKKKSQGVTNATSLQDNSGSSNAGNRSRKRKRSRKSKIA